MRNSSIVLLFISCLIMQTTFGQETSEIKPTLKNSTFKTARLITDKNDLICLEYVPSFTPAPVFKKDLNAKFELSGTNLFYEEQPRISTHPMDLFID